MVRLLIVDDEPDIIELIRRYAERAGYEITGAESSEKTGTVFWAELTLCCSER